MTSLVFGFENLGLGKETYEQLKEMNRSSGESWIFMFLKELRNDEIKIPSIEANPEQSERLIWTEGQLETYSRSQRREREIGEGRRRITNGR